MLANVHGPPERNNGLLCCGKSPWDGPFGNSCTGMARKVYRKIVRYDICKGHSPLDGLIVFYKRSRIGSYTTPEIRRGLRCTLVLAHTLVLHFLDLVARAQL